jgi:signal transduction protein with GAF and PtsI domain
MMPAGKREAHMNLDRVTAALAKAADIEAALRDAAPEICKAFTAERLTVYRTTADGSSLKAIVQTGLETYGAVKVKIDSNRSLAGRVAATGRLLNIADVYDEKELAPLAMKMRMFRAVDERTGFQTRQVLAAPVIGKGKVLGVVELLNRADKVRFPDDCERGALALCQALAPMFERQPATA